MDEARVPRFDELMRRPVATGLAIAAIATTLLWWSGRNIDALVMSRTAFSHEPWRLFTSALPHVDIIHLGFNVYWLLVIGTRIERSFGARALIVLSLVTSVGSAALEHALFDGGVGLSGIGYGLVGFGWAVERDERQISRPIVPEGTIRLFSIWFVVCCITTLTSVWKVANAAHAGGAILGVLTGLAWAHRGMFWPWVTVLSLAGFIAMASPPLRLFVNLGEGIAHDLADEAYELIEANPEGAVERYSQALTFMENANWRFNLGVAYERLGLHVQTSQMMLRAHELEPDNVAYRRGAAAAQAREAADAQERDDQSEMIRYLERALELDPQHEDASVWRRILANASQ